jgi:hypothetical protein
VAARCADNSVTDCVIVAAGDADSLSAGDGEGVGIAATAAWQRNTISKQEIFIQIAKFTGSIFQCVACEAKLSLLVSVTVWFSRYNSLTKT